MSLKGARVLLTGGTGFIGSHVARLLTHKNVGADVRLLVRPSSRGDALGPLWDALPRLAADLDDPGSLAAAVKACDPEYVLHLAKPRDGASFDREARATTALAASLAAGAPRMKRWVRTAHAASDAHGRGADAALARALASRFRLDVVTLELFLVYGPGQRAGEFPRGLAEAAIAGRPVEIPAEAKDMVHVLDAAEAYRLAALDPRAAGKWIPIGGGALVPGTDVARAAVRAAGRPVTDVVPPRADPFHGGHPADLRAAREILDWAPSITVDEGMAQLVQWLRDPSRSAGG